MKRTGYIWIIGLWMALLLIGQSPAQGQYLPVHTSHEGIYLFLDELATEQVIDLHSLVKPYARKEIAAMLLGAHPSLGIWYILPIGAATIRIIQLSIRLLKVQTRKSAMAVFHMSNAYLGLVLLFITLVSITNN